MCWPHFAVVPCGCETFQKEIEFTVSMGNNRRRRSSGEASQTEAARYRSPIARTSSCRVSTLILFAIVAFSDLPPRVADSMR